MSAVNVDTGGKTTARANDTGFCSLRPLPIGSYSATVEHAGFHRYQRNGVVLNTSLALELNVSLEPGARRVLDDSFGAVPAGTAPNQTVTFLEPNRRTGYSEQFSLRIQHELPGQMAIEYGYIGNLSRKLPSANLPTNQIPSQLLKAGSGTKDRPYPQFTQVTLLGPTPGVSSYYAGVVKLEKRFSGGFNILATYTWSKTLDNTQYMFGNQGIGNVRAPGMTTVNGSMIRTFVPWERKTLQFRGDLFNAPNHPNLGTPSQVFKGPGFGIINNARPRARSSSVSS